MGDLVPIQPLLFYSTILWGRLATLRCTAVGTYQAPFLIYE